jgi:hypothetical protein
MPSSTAAPCTGKSVVAVNLLGALTRTVGIALDQIKGWEDEIRQAWHGHFGR